MATPSKKRIQELLRVPARDAEAIKDIMENTSRSERALERAMVDIAATLGYGNVNELHTTLHDDPLAFFLDVYDQYAMTVFYRFDTASWQINDLETVYLALERKGYDVVFGGSGW